MLKENVQSKDTNQFNTSNNKHYLARSNMSFFDKINNTYINNNMPGDACD